MSDEPYGRYAQTIEGKALLMTMDALSHNKTDPDMSEIKQMLADSTANELLDLAAAASWLQGICQDLYDERLATT